MNGYLQFGRWGGPYQTIRAEGVKKSPLAMHLQGLSQTASGYGKKITTQWMLKYQGRWRRVYCCCFSNSGTNYVRVDGQDVVVTISEY